MVGFTMRISYYTNNAYDYFPTLLCVKNIYISLLIVPITFENEEVRFVSEGLGKLP